MVDDKVDTDVKWKRAKKFARTFSETIDEDDDAFSSAANENKDEDPLSGRICL